MLWTIVIVLFVLWALGFGFGVGNWFHSLPSSNLPHALGKRIDQASGDQECQLSLAAATGAARPARWAVRDADAMPHTLRECS